MATIAQIVPQEELERFQRLAKRQFDSWQKPGGSSIDEDERIARNVHPHVLSILDELVAARAALAATPAPAAPQVAGVAREETETEEPIVALYLPSSKELEARSLIAQHGFDFTDVADLANTVPALLQTIDALRGGFLQATKAAKEAAPLGGWVAVGERLPEDWGYYLCHRDFIGESGDRTKYTTTGLYDPAKGGFSHNSEVTHWQHLPTPPTAPAHAAQ